PWLHQLRARSPRFVRQFHCYYKRSDFSLLVRHRRRLLVFPMRTALKQLKAAKQEISRFSCKERTYMPGSKTTQGRTATRTHAPVRVAFRYANNVGTLNEFKAFAASMRR